MKNSKLLAILLVVLLLLLGSCTAFKYLNSSNKGNDTPNQSTETKETTADTTEETVEDTNTETTTDTVAETVVEVQESGNADSQTHQIKLNKSSQTEFNSDLTKRMQEEIASYAVTLVAAQETTLDKLPKEHLQAIARYENNDSFGYVVRYGENKAGLAQYYKDSTTGVLVLFDAKMTLELDEEPIKNDSPAEYKEVAEKLFQSQVSGEATIEYGY